MSDTIALPSRVAATAPRTTRVASACLIAAALFFGAAWFLMPVAGETDAREIFRIVTPQRGAVLAASIAQLVAVTLYVPAMVALIRDRTEPFASRLWRPAAVLLVGTLGLAADAVDHLLSYAMTAPGVDQAAQVDVMEWMQGPALLMIAPLIACWFAGAAWLSVAYAKAGGISRWNPRLYLVALAIAGCGAALGQAGDVVDGRTVGVLTLWTIAAAQLWLGAVLWRREAR
jgi:hypothetical protein